MPSNKFAFSKTVFKSCCQNTNVGSPSVPKAGVRQEIHPSNWTFLFSQRKTLSLYSWGWALVLTRKKTCNSLYKSSRRVEKVNTTTAVIPARAACKGTKKMHFQLQKPSLRNKYLNREIKGSKRSRRMAGEGDAENYSHAKIF